MKIKALIHLLLRDISIAFYCPWRNCLSLLTCLAMGVVGPTAASQTSAHFSDARTTVGSGLSYPSDVAVDASGNVYIADLSANRIVKVPWTGSGYGPQTEVTSGLGQPQGLAVDGNGNVYVADTDNGRAVKVAWTGSGYGPQMTVVSGLSYPTSVAVDGSGNVYVTDLAANSVVKVPWTGNGYGPQTTVGVGLNQPLGVAVDSIGNVYITDYGNNRALKVPWTGSSYGSQTTVGTGLSYPTGIAVDSGSNVYIADYGNNRIVRVPWTGNSYGSETALGTGFSGPYAISVDLNGNVYVADYADSSYVLKLQRTANFGAVAVGAISQVQPLYFVFDSPGTLSAAQVVMQGATGLDFVDSGTGTCKADGTNYAAGATCTVDVTFAPTLPGVRYGAAMLRDAGGNTIATGYVYGTGTAPQLAFPPGVQSTIVGPPSVNGPLGLAVDGSGNVYIADSVNNRVVKQTFSGGTYTQTIVSTGPLSGPRGVAVDGAGNLYVMSTFSDRVLKETPTPGGGYAESIVKQGGFNYAYGVAVDSGGNVYIANAGAAGSPDGYVLKEALQSDGSYIESRVDSNLRDPYGLAVDGNGNIYFGETTANVVTKETPSGAGYIKSVVATGLATPNAVAVDGTGNVYIGNTSGNSVIKEVLQQDGTYAQSVVLNTGLSNPYGVAVDGAGSVYISDTNANRVIKVVVSDPAALSFANTPIGSISPDSPQTISLQNVGNADLQIYNRTLDSLDFGGGSGSCYTVSVLAANASCALAISFAPKQLGARTGNVVVSDNHLNALPNMPAAQKVPLSGTGQIATTTTSLVISTDATIGVGTKVVLTAVVSPSAIGSLTAGGSITFFDNGTPLATVPISTSSANPGEASTGELSFANGTHALTAVYTGDTNFATSTGTHSLTVTQTPTTALLVSSDNPSTYGESVTFTASVAATATGTIQFYEESTPLGAAVPLIGGVATVSSNSLSVGVHTLQAIYSGDGSHSPVSSDVLDQNVLGATLTVSSMSATRTYGQANPAFNYLMTGFKGSDTEQSSITGAPLILNSTTAFSNVGSYALRITPGTLNSANYSFSFVDGLLTITKATPGASGTTAVTLSSSLNPSSWNAPVQITALLPINASGSVAFYEGATLLGTSPVVASAAVLTTSILAPGNHLITAIYSGDTNYNGIATAALNQGVDRAAAAVIVTSSSATPVAGIPVQLTAAVPDKATGTVTFHETTISLGTVPVTAGRAILTTSTFSPGIHIIIATYNGDSNYISSVSLPITVTVTAAPDYMLTSTTAPQLIPPGASASYKISVSSVGMPFTNSVTLTATNLPQGATYTFTPSVVIPGADGTTSTLIITSPMLGTRLQRNSRTPQALAILLLPLLAFGRMRMRPRRLLLWILFSCLSLGVVIGCGTGGYFNQPERTYTITVTGTSGSLVRSTTVTLTVE